MATDHAPENLEQALANARHRLELLDPTWMASRSGTEYSFSRRSFLVPFFGEDYMVTFPGGEARGPGGGEAAKRETLIILHYLIQADGIGVKGQWVAYRDLPGARYHEPAFVADVERPLSLGLSGRLEALRAWAEREARVLNLPGDIALAWDALPRVPLLIIFNEADEEFPAAARVLFDVTAPGYLPTEDLSVLAEIASQRLLRLFA